MTWNQRHVAWVARVDPSEKLLDAAGFCELLQADCPAHKCTFDSHGRLEKCFFPLHSAELPAVMWSAKHTVIYDNTFNTSAYDLKLGVFSTVDSNGKTRIVACALMRFEDSPSFEWVMIQFRSWLGTFPAVVLTDGDLAIAKAVATVFPTSKHLLCVWHLARNIAKHIKGCFGATRRGVANKAWQAFYRAFWDILLKTDCGSIDDFEDEWFALRELLTETATASPDVIDHAFMYLGGGRHDEVGSFSIFDLRSRWAYRYTWSTFTLGANSTQRGEGVFSLIKGRVRPGSLLTELYKKLHLLDEEITILSETILSHSVKLWSRTVSSAALLQCVCLASFTVRSALRSALRSTARSALRSTPDPRLMHPRSMPDPCPIHPRSTSDPCADLLLCITGRINASTTSAACRSRVHSIHCTSRCCAACSRISVYAHRSQ